MMNRAMHLEGHLPADHKLAPHWQFRHLSRIAQQITSYQRDDLWESDTRKLPAPLGKLRRRARAFAETHLAPLSAEADLAAHEAPGQSSPAITNLLKVAAREGWLSYFLPGPLGSMSWKRGLYPPVWQSSLVVEEFSRVCGGLMLLLSAHHLGCIPLLLSGDINVIRRFLAPVYRSCHKGDPHLVAFAITEPGAGSVMAKTGTEPVITNQASLPATAMVAGGSTGASVL
ncbi:acyl-CoA dehydrogenase family protein [Marinobacter maritimus]|uniref:acyl-CoA dehydrogenase family protein n=1 Tax=Marinobacter maritimus TaxID=277961 RepID=UPI001C92F887|nr:acyl-CoA dehydrogenase family protein [Marinobacter maritimus]